MIGIKQAAAFSEPCGIAVLPDGTSCVVADRTNRCVRIVTRGGVASTLAGSGGPGGDDGTLAAASFDDPAEVAVDVDGHVLVVDWARNHFRKVDPSTGQVTTLRDENGVAIVSSDGDVAGGCCAIDTIGSIWFANDDGIDIISNTSFSAGYNAWTFMQWKPNSQRHHLCPPQGTSLKGRTPSWWFFRFVHGRTLAQCRTPVGCGRGRTCRLRSGITF